MGVDVDKLIKKIKKYFIIIFGKSAKKPEIAKHTG